MYHYIPAIDHHHDGARLYTLLAGDLTINTH
jgi:hypothetical protein